MGHFNEILAGRFNRFVQKHFSMKGREGTPTLSADLQMGMVFNSGAENRYLEAWDLFGFTTLSAAFAANLNQGQLRNPAGTGVVCVVTRAIYNNTVADTSVTLNLSKTNTADQPSVRSTTSWDSRGRPASTAIVSDNSGAAKIATAGLINIVGVNTQAGVSMDLIPPGGEIPLLPGTTLAIQSGTANVAMLYTFWWRERALETSELQ